VEPIALQFRERIRSKFQQLAALGIERPSLVALLASDDEAALSYAEWTAKVRQPCPPSPPQHSKE
jgi:5,10-methylene-tetrahydrofolate dehydrogenase/methenyl tetrahydrofolate cyclohydrolase